MLDKPHPLWCPPEAKREVDVRRPAKIIFVLAGPHCPGLKPETRLLGEVAATSDAAERATDLETYFRSGGGQPLKAQAGSPNRQLVVRLAGLMIATRAWLLC